MSLCIEHAFILNEISHLHASMQILPFWKLFKLHHSEIETFHFYFCALKSLHYIFAYMHIFSSKMLAAWNIEKAGGNRSTEELKKEHELSGKLDKLEENKE